MVNSATWNWEPGERQVADLGAWEAQYKWVEEVQASLDGERFAAVVNADDEFTACVNGELWENLYERVWYLRFSPDSRLTGLASDMGEWAVVVDDEPWPDKYGMVWDTKFSADGSGIAVAVQQDTEYGMALNGQLWDTLYPDANHFAISPCGTRTASVVQREAMGQAEVFRYQGGMYSLAVDGKMWDNAFVNAWEVAFSADGKHVAAEMRTDLYDHSIVVDGQPWAGRFQCVWGPRFNPATGAVVAPVRQGGKWSLFQDDQPLWRNKYFECWHHCFSADGKVVAAIVSPKFSRWTAAVDDQAWNTTFGDMAADLCLSPDGSRAAFLGKENEQWKVCVDDRNWAGEYDMAWAPVFSADSRHVAATVRKDGKFAVLVDGHPVAQDLDMAWDAAFGPDSDRVLLRTVKDGKCRRTVLKLDNI